MGTHGSTPQRLSTHRVPGTSHILPSVGFVQQPCELRILFPVSQAGKLMLMEATHLTLRHTAGLGQSWDSNLGPCATEAWAASTLSGGFL